MSRELQKFVEFARQTSKQGKISHGEAVKLRDEFRQAHGDAPCPSLTTITDMMPKLDSIVLSLQGHQRDRVGPDAQPTQQDDEEETDAEVEPDSLGSGGGGSAPEEKKKKRGTQAGWQRLRNKTVFEVVHAPTDVAD